MRQFHLGDILSITTRILLSPRHMEGVYDILDYMTGDNLSTHELPQAREKCAPHLLRQHPQLAGIVVPDFRNKEGRGAIEPWLRQQIAIYGERLPVQPIPSPAHN